MQIYNMEQVAKELGLSYVALWRRTKDGVLPPPQFQAGKRYFYTAGDITKMKKLMAKQAAIARPFAPAS